MRRAPEVDYVLDDLLAETRLSQSSLAFKFKQLVGLPPHAFLIACRIRRAKELLAQTTRSVLSIASELKFSSSQHFATRFKQEAGVSPLTWRKRSRIKEKR
jgi:AraC family transcriptional regulator